MKFTDDVSFNTDGELRMERRFDGLYVVGKGVLIPVSDEERAADLIKELKTKP